VNGFHDTANAVATVIYTHSLEPNIAVVWSGFWNLGTWYFGLPASSSHTLIGSVIGVGIANQLMQARSGTSGVDWAQATNIGKSLFLSPLVGFAVAYLLLKLMKAIIKNKALYKAPVGTEPPPFWIRALLILTCTGVSFFHGSNDGQKGMGLIMLILIGTVPTAYALNHAVTRQQSDDFIAVSQQAAATLSKYVSPSAVIGDPRDEVTDYVRTKEFTLNTMLALRELVSDVGNETVLFGELAKVPNDRVRNFRNDMYLVSEAFRLMQKNKQGDISATDWGVIANYKKNIDHATRFIPAWVKVAVAMALGLGTMVGWKRIVVTVGEKIGKDHLTYGQGAAAEITAMMTIGAADGFGLPVSTTHVLSSGIAGTMAANHTGLQWGTVRNLLMAWVLTLPAAMVLSGFLFGDSAISSEG
jgi:PiT family inorganic phosphate transporter